MLDIGRKLKEIRLENSLTQSQMAQIIKVSRVVYNRYENNQRDIPIEFLIIFADFFNTTLDYLVGRENF